MIDVLFLSKIRINNVLDRIVLIYCWGKPFLLRFIHVYSH
ncbi:hypothetical protein EVA_11649 [gut metagenome]|uniref:Uncharacterized protein n=1 Tax=gut metagenome TaxID=749906 RepID=J9G087_9ZZZZ